MPDIVDAANTKIRTYLHGQKIYDPNNLPDPEPPDIRGNYAVVGGAFRWIYNEDRDGRDQMQVVKNGDVIAVMFDARIFGSGSSFESFPLFYSNIQASILSISSSNQEFNYSDWPTIPRIIRIGGGQMLSALESALVSCRVGDEVRVFLPPDIAYGNRQNGSVPANSTLAFKISIEGMQEEGDEVSEYLNSLNIYDRNFAPGNAAGYYDIIDGGYRHVLNESRPDRPSEVAALGDTIYYKFDARVFSSTFENSVPFDSNIEEIIARIAADNPGVDTSQWPRDPQAVIVGENKVLINDEVSGQTILNSLAASLPSCRPGDEVWVFLPPEVAYGDQQEGLVPSNSTLVYKLTITEIRK